MGAWVVDDEKLYNIAVSTWRKGLIIDVEFRNDWYYITYEPGITFGVMANRFEDIDVIPQKGDEILFIGDWGIPNLGLFINGIFIFHMTYAEYREWSKNLPRS